MVPDARVAVMPPIDKPLLGGQMGLDLNIFSWLLSGPVDYLISLIAVLAGLS